MPFTPSQENKSCKSPAASCRPGNIETIKLGKKTCGKVGFISSAASGVYSAWTGAHIGAVVGLIAGPLGSGIGTLAEAVLGASVDATAGCAAGARLGQIIDERLVDNYRCQKCEHRFSLPQTNHFMPDDIDQTSSSSVQH